MTDTNGPLPSPTPTGGPPTTRTMTETEQAREAIEAVLTEMAGRPVRTWDGRHAACALEIIRLRAELARWKMYHHYGDENAEAIRRFHVGPAMDALAEKNRAVLPTPAAAAAEHKNNDQ